jgi:hypothetical protein
MYLFERSNGSFNHLDPDEFPLVFAACTEIYPRPKFVLMNRALGPLSLREKNPVLVHTALEDDRDLFGSIEAKAFQRITNLYITTDTSCFPVIQLASYDFLDTTAPSFYPACHGVLRVDTPLTAVGIRTLFLKSFHEKIPGLHEVISVDEEIPVPCPVQQFLKPHTIRAIVKAAVGTDCPITFEPIQEATSAVTTCQHVFKREAIVEWLKKNTSCPVCRDECSVI